MSIQGVFNTEVTKQTSIWVSSGWVQLTAFGAFQKALSNVNTFNPSRSESL